MIYLTVPSLIATIASPFLPILPLVIGPQLSFADYRDTQLHRPIEIEVIYPKGKFTIRLLLSGIKNKGGSLTRSAEKCEVNLVTPVDSIGRRLPFRISQKTQVKIDYDIDPSSAQNIVDALESTIFEKREVDVKRGQTLQIIIGFFLESGEFYFATEDAMKLHLAKGDAVLSAPPFYLIAKGSNFSMGQSSIGMVIFGPNWKEAQLGYIERSKKLVEGRYRTLVRFPEPMKTSEKFQRMLYDSIKDRVHLEELIISKGQLKPIKTKIVYNGFVVKVRSFCGFSIRYLTATFPTAVARKSKLIYRVLGGKRSQIVPAIGVYGQSVHIDVPESVQEKQCGNMTDFIRCINELKHSLSDNDFLLLSSKYNFPVDFLKSSVQLTNKFEQKNEQQRLRRKFKEQIIDSYKEKYGYHVNRKFIKVEVDSIMVALSELYLDNKWLSIFRHWQLLDEEKRTVEIESAERVERLSLLLMMISWAALLLASFTIKPATLFGAFGIILIVFDVAILNRLHSRRRRSPELLPNS